MMRSGECFDILEGGSRDYTNECRRVWREGVSSLKDLKGRERLLGVFAGAYLDMRREYEAAQVWQSEQG